MEVEAIDIKVPSRKKIRPKDVKPPASKYAVVPARIAFDKDISDGAIRTLVALCKYTNKAGITWISQQRLAQELGISRPALTGSMAKLRRAGYVQIVRRGFRGLHNNTLRVVFDPTISAEEAIAIASNGTGDTRTATEIAEEQNMSPEEQKAKIAQMLQGIVKPVTRQATAKPYTMPAGGETAAVKRIRAGLKQPGTGKRRSAHVEGADKSAETHPNLKESIQEVCYRRFEERIDEDSVKGLEMLTTPAELDALITEVQARYRAEGIEPPRMARTLDAVLDLIDRRLQDGLQRPTGDDRGAG